MPVQDPFEFAGLEKMRLILGPNAAHERLSVHLREQRSQIHWAVNSFFRQHFSTPNDPDSQFLCACAEASQVVSARGDRVETRSSLCPQDSPGILHLPDDLVLTHLCSLLLPRELVRLACTSKRARDLCADETLWSTVYTTLHTQQSDAAKPGSCREAVREHVCRVRRQGCAACHHGFVVPLVFGFPSAALMRAAECDRLRFGWDFKTAQDASWQCIGCRSKFHQWPWALRQRATVAVTHVRLALRIMHPAGRSASVTAHLIISSAHPPDS